MRLRGGGRGAVLLMALGMVLFLSAVGTAALTIMMSAWKGGGERRAVQRARVVAENGLEYALWRLDRDPAWPGEETAEVPMGVCSLLVRGAGGATEVISATCGEGPNVTVSARYRRPDGGGYEIVSWSESVER